MIEVHVVRNGSKKCWQMYYVDPISKRRVWRSSETTKKSEAERAAAKWEAELEAGEVRRVNITWEAFIERFDDEHLAGLAEKTGNAYRTALNHVEERLRPARLSGMTSDALSKLVKSLRDDGISETSIKTYLRHIGAALRWAAEIGLIRTCPKMPKVKPPKREKAMRGRPVTGEELDRILAAVPKIRPTDAADWVFYLNGLWWSGLRLSESVELSWDQDAAFRVDFETKHPSFRIYAEHQKSRRDQRLPMAPEFATQLASVPKEKRNGRVFRLLNLRTGQPLLPDAVGKVVSEIGEKAGVVVDAESRQHATAHDLRRAFGTRWARRVKPVVLKQMMRHTDIGTTMRYYVDLDTADIAAEIWAAVPRTVNPNVNPGPYTPSGDDKEKAATPCEDAASEAAPV